MSIKQVEKMLLDAHRVCVENGKTSVCSNCGLDIPKVIKMLGKKK